MRILLFICLTITIQAAAQDISSRSVVPETGPRQWSSFPLSATRILPGNPFYAAMTADQRYLIGMDVDRMLNHERRQAHLPATGPYPGSNQPEGTRPGDLNHYLSAISLMYAQTGDTAFLNRERYILKCLTECYRLSGGDTTRLRWRRRAWQKILDGELTLNGTDEYGYPWGGTIGNEFYSIHKELAALRDAYVYTGDTNAFDLLKQKAAPIVSFISRANPDLFDDLLDIEHGGMNEVLADCFALTGDSTYLRASFKCNHQKVILNLAEGKDILPGRHANMQVPTLVGTARQYQLTADPVAGKATRNFLDIVYHDHLDVIGGSGRYERYGYPGETTEDLGYTADETCVTYNMLKVALDEFETTGELRHMDYYERALYNHILASQDPESMGVTYYTSLMPGSFKSFSKGYDLEGVWCCVGTGMENHAKYGQAIYFHNERDVLVNLFIPSTLRTDNLALTLATRFPDSDDIMLTIDSMNAFKGALCFRYPGWVRRPCRVWINDREIAVTAKPGQTIRLSGPWKTGDRVRLNFPQDFHFEEATDDHNMVAILHGPLVLAGALGADHMPGSDLVRAALPEYRDAIPFRGDIPVLVVDKADPTAWLKRDPTGLSWTAHDAGLLNGKKVAVHLLPYYAMRHQRYTVYWKMFTPEEFALRKATVCDEIDPANGTDEKKHHLQGQHTDTSGIKDNRHFWENNRPGRFAADSGWFSYDLQPEGGSSPATPRAVAVAAATAKDSTTQWLVVTYWGSTPNGHSFDILADDKLLATEDLSDDLGMHYYERAYRLPATLGQNGRPIRITFHAHAGQTAGPVYGLRLTTAPGAFQHYLFY